MRLLITGGAGFIGSNFSQYMQKQHPDWAIHILDSLTYAGNTANLDPLSYTLHQHCISDRIAVQALFKRFKFDSVIHFAAESHVDRSIADSQPFIQTNILGTSVLLDSALQASVPQFIHISTDEVYGSIQTGYFTETSPLNPSSPYAASKASADLLALSYYKTYKLPVRITRCSNNYGPRQFPEKLIPLMYQRARANQSLPVYGTGLNIRDWLHVDDHCRAIYAVMTQGQDGEVYNIGGNTERSNKAIIQFILAYLNKSPDLIQYVTDRLGHDFRYAVCSQKLRHATGWEPEIAFESGLESTLDFYRAVYD